VALAHRRLTLEEFLQLPEEKPALEYVGGIVRQKMSPKLRHSVLQTKLAQYINAVAEPSHVGLAMTEARATYAGESTVPDVSIYRWERIPHDAAGELLDDSRIPPDIAIEIVSPGQSVNELIRRCRWYVSNGVEIALLVDASDRSVLAFRPGGGIDEWKDADRIDIGAVVPGFELTAEELFGTLRIGAPSQPDE
jgi:Uma2 family endonuclease